jgi:hypothetical protein
MFAISKLSTMIYFCAHLFFSSPFQTRVSYSLVLYHLWSEMAVKVTLPMRKTTVKMRCFLYSSSSKTTNPTFLSPQDVRCPFLACVALSQTHLYLGFRLGLYQTNGKQSQPHCLREICRKPEIETKYELAILPMNQIKKMEKTNSDKLFSI